MQEIIKEDWRNQIKETENPAQIYMRWSKDTSSFTIDTLEMILKRMPDPQFYTLFRIMQDSINKLSITTLSAIELELGLSGNEEFIGVLESILKEDCSEEWCNSDLNRVLKVHHRKKATKEVFNRWSKKHSYKIDILMKILEKLGHDKAKDILRNDIESKIMRKQFDIGCV